MRYRYNIALLSTGHPEVYVHAAQKHFAQNAQTYILGPNSLPHITLCQFMAEQSSLPLLIKGLEKAEKSPSIQLTGLRFSSKSPDSPLWGASLSVARSSDLMRLHLFVAQLLYDHHLKPLNDTGDLYTPHLTLAKVDHLDIQGFSKDILKKDQFDLILGESDDVGQLTNVLHRFVS
ncbi:2'-5' RNA ligase family protein [Candidatus Nucleicultrix amoebiphila]|jgi:2'-5' RNA ligase|uniref:Phosphoesterase HXTX domain-containing protein n=1 Tax=Candidatus Nucleicultrix amoebiphila FS5 TaxID=1414854 RepID=A0A1W6N5N7_9PROT|nr:hypothetical protein [Candidatus Nucleicultrix amoebiphila]ARN85121.1 hypothetical protein GQ61_07300 [Candidatus Nucleicultrix amoebiphila FS5]